MAKTRTHRKSLRSPEEIDRDRELRAKYRGRPTLAELAASGEYTTPIKQGELLALMHFAACIKARRQELNISLADLAALSGIDKSALSRLENGLAGNPTIGTLERIARSLKTRLRLALEDDRKVAGR
jgi:DNA-binding Xre family transcriptional regulator